MAGTSLERLQLQNVVVDVHVVMKATSDGQTTITKARDVSSRRTNTDLQLTEQRSYRPQTPPRCCRPHSQFSHTSFCCRYMRRDIMNASMTYCRLTNYELLR